MGGLAARKMWAGCSSFAAPLKGVNTWCAMGSGWMWGIEGNVVGMEECGKLLGKMVIYDKTPGRNARIYHLRDKINRPEGRSINLPKCL